MTGPKQAGPAQAETVQLEAAWQAAIGAIAAARRTADVPQRAAVGVTVLTGFLGSGKTTVLRRLLTETAGLHIAAIVNDIGAVNIDGLAAASVAPDRIELTNGCACCALVDDLAETLERVAEAGANDAIVVEASGIADPATLALAVESAAGCTLDGVVAVVDAQQMEFQLGDARIGPVVLRQIDVCHLVVLSKVDAVDDATVRAMTGRIGDIAPGRMVIPSAHGRIDPRVLLSAAVRGASFPVVESGHPFEVATATVMQARPWETADVAGWFDDPPERLLRAKGWFNSADGSWHEVQAVGRHWRIEPAAVGAEPVIVLIGDSQTTVDRAAASLHSLGES